MSVTSKPLVLVIVLLAAFAALGLFGRHLAGAGGAQSPLEADGARLLKGAIDMHFHMDPPGVDTKEGQGQADISKVRTARAHGVRALVIKDHNEPTGGLVYLLRQEIPDFLMYGAFVLNLSNGGLNVEGVKFMLGIKGAPGKVVWMPAGDTETEVKHSKNPDAPFVSVQKGGQLLPEVKTILGLIAKNDLVLASGHILAPDALMLFSEAQKMGVKHMVATHAFDLTGKMTTVQMQAAAKLGVIIEFDYRNVFDEGGARLDVIRQVGPEHCLISEFWTNKPGATREYAGFAGAGEWVAAMHKRGFTDHELDVMVKDNPAKLLGLPVQR